MCFAGLNAIHQGSDFTELFKRMQGMAAEVERLRSQVRAVEETVGRVSEHVGNTDTNVMNMRTRLERSVHWLNSRVSQMEANMSPPVAMPIPAQHTEVPMLPVEDGTWNYYDPNPARNRSSCGPPWARRWIKHNQKLCAVLVCGALVICGAGVAARSRWKPPKDGMGAHGQKKLAGAADPCKVSCRHFVALPRCHSGKSVDCFAWSINGSRRVGTIAVTLLSAIAGSLSDFGTLLFRVRTPAMHAWVEGGDLLSGGLYDPH